MGIVKKVILEKEIPTPQQNKRLTVELCENVHLHYRNLRLEFPKAEFIQFLKELREIDPDYIERFQFGAGKFEAISYLSNLPAESEFNRRLRIEEQADGTFHVHYRNLRLELESLSELGISNE